MVQRFEEILGTAIAEYTPNAIKFRGLSLARLQEVLAEGYTTTLSYCNASPSVGSFIEFGVRCQEKGVIATFDGVAFPYGESPDLVVDGITLVGVGDLDFAGEFVKFVWGCDEMEISSQQLYAWWD